MNEIKIKRLIIAGLLTLLVFIGMEFLVESLMGPIIFGPMMRNYYQGIELQGWGFKEHALNIGIAIINCMMLIWLYAALRPMFGVGTKTALICSLYWLVFISVFSINMANLGYYPWNIAFMEYRFH
jgi:hypothetical protein